LLAGPSDWYKRENPMGFFALLDLAGGEVILILTMVLLLLGARRLPELIDGFREGLMEFIRATREVADEFAEATTEEEPAQKTGPPVLMALTFVLAAGCVLLVVYGFCK
jgi:sec-independent protein translocase protein TatA